MKLSTLALSIFFFALAITAKADGNTDASDTLVFRKYALEDPMPKTGLGAMSAIYRSICQLYASEARRLSNYVSPFDILKPNMYNSQVDLRTPIPLYYIENSSKVKRESEYKMAIRDLKASFKKKKSITDIEKEKEDMVASLAAMDTLLKHKPTFFADIHGKYKGNIRAYVDDLYKKSAMCSRRQLRRIVRATHPERILRDMGLQYTLGLAFYELWIKQVREGKVGKTKGD